jgi:hypothetical protein
VAFGGACDPVKHTSAARYGWPKRFDTAGAWGPPTVALAAAGPSGPNPHITHPRSSEVRRVARLTRKLVPTPSGQQPSPSEIGTSDQSGPARQRERQPKDEGNPPRSSADTDTSGANAWPSVHHRRSRRHRHRLPAPAALARFWADVLDGYQIAPYGDDELFRLAELGITDLNDDLTTYSIGKPLVTEPVKPFETFLV